MHRVGKQKSQKEGKLIPLMRPLHSSVRPTLICPAPCLDPPPSSNRTLLGGSRPSPRATTIPLFPSSAPKLIKCRSSLLLLSRSPPSQRRQPTSHHRMPERQRLAKRRWRRRRPESRQEEGLPLFFANPISPSSSPDVVLAR